MNKVRIKLFMVGGFTFDLWTPEDDFKLFVEAVADWKRPSNDDNPMCTFYDTSRVDNWDNPESMINVDCRQIVAYTMIGIYGIDE